MMLQESAHGSLFRWRPRREIAALTVACVFPTVMAWIYFVALAANTGESSSSAASPALRGAYALGKLVQFSFPLVYLYFAAPHSWSVRPPRFGGLMLGLGFGALVAAAMLLLYFGLLRETLIEMGLEREVRSKLEEFGAATPYRFLGFAAYISIVHSLLEEYYWRWFVFRRLGSLCGLAPAMAISSLAFMAHHVIVLDVYLPGHFLTAVVPFSLAIAAGGAFWSWLYARTDSLVAVWLSHVIIDAGIMVIGFDLLRMC